MHGKQNRTKSTLKNPELKEWLVRNWKTAQKKLLMQSGRNAVFSAISIMLNPLLQLAVTPILFRALGAELFGTWALLNAILAVSGVASLGLGEAATKFVALHHARNDPQRIEKVVRSILTIYCSLGGLMGFSVWIFSKWLSSAVFSAVGENQEITGMALKIGGATLLFRFIYGIFEATVRGFHRYDLESIWAAFNSIGATILAAGCVLAGKGLVAILIASFCVLSIGTIGLARVVKSLTGNWNFLIPSFDRTILREVFGFGMFTWIQTLNGMVLHQVDRIIIGSTMGPASVGYYSVSLQIVQTAHAILSKASAFTFPLIIRFREEGKWNELWSLYQRGMVLTTVGGWIISGGILTFGDVLLRTWMGGEFADKASDTLQILAIWNACLATTIIQFYFLNATGGERLNAGFGFLSSLLFVIGAFMFIPSVGAKGAAFARLFAVSSSLVTRTVFFRRVFGDRRWYAWLMPLVPLVAPIILTVLISNVRIRSDLERWIFIVGGYLVSTAVCFFGAKTVYYKMSIRLEGAFSIRD